jgi:hypothetical protein
MKEMKIANCHIETFTCRTGKKLRCLVSVKYIHGFPPAVASVLLFFITSFFFNSCKKLVEVQAPSTSLTSDNVYRDDATAAAVLTGIYVSLADFSPLRAQTINSISLVSGLSADELTLHGGAANANNSLVQFFQNQLSPGLSGSATQTIWSHVYSKIYIVNLALERLMISQNLSPVVKQQLIGEARFLRAFFYFYLVNLYGDLPLATTSDYRLNASLPRTSKSQIDAQIINDLKEAQNLLSDNYIGADAKTGTTERARPNKWAATALLARVYLYMGDWTNAEERASLVIANASKYGLTSLLNVFFKNSNEAIWQIQPVNIGWNTEDARVFIIPSTGPTSNSSVTGNPVYLSNQLMQAFESADQRKADWTSSVTLGSAPTTVKYHFPYKYRTATLNAPITEYLMVLRLAEQYLIRAESRAQLNKITEAITDVNAIRTRAGLPGTPANDKPGLLAAILKERQVELFTEWGHRWLDLKRTGSMDAVMSSVAPLKGTSWNPNWALYPIPHYDILLNANLVQNPGY